MNVVERDKCFGRRLARMGAARLVITRASDRVPTPNERALFWRWRSGNPGLGNVVFLRPRNAPAAADAANPPAAAPARGTSAAGNPIHPEDTP